MGKHGCQSWRDNMEVFQKHLFGSFQLAKMIVMLPNTVSRHDKQFL